MFLLFKRYPRWFAIVTATAVALRLFFILKFAFVAGDALVYADIAKNLLNLHIYGLENLHGVVKPTLIRLPGYPLFLAGIFRVFGQDHFRTVMAIQAVFDLGTCLLVADIARRLFGDRAARWAYLLAAICPFTLSYVSTPLTECLELFFTALATQQALIALQHQKLGHWAGSGAAVAGAILLRPDGGLVLCALGLVILIQMVRLPKRRRELLTGGVLLAVVSLAPLVPWAIRNWYSMHVFQPLVTRRATDPGEYVAYGLEKWLHTWLLDYVSTEDIGFKIPGEPIKISDMPNRAFDSPEERAYVAKLFDQYNQHGYALTPELDAKLGRLADEKAARHPIRTHVLLPIGRMLDMWLRPRTEMLPLNTRWWEFKADPHDSIIGASLGLLNLALIVAAIAMAWKARFTPYISLLIVYPIIRSAFLATTGASEDRYTLESFPLLLVLAGGYLALWRDKIPALSNAERQKLSAR